MILVVGYIVFCSVLITMYFYGKRKVNIKMKTNAGETYKASTISVVIPFRNEEKNIPSLIQSIENLTNLPLEFIWVNDHSTDNSILKLEHALNSEHQSLFHLPNSIIGKKQAILLGISKAKGDFILTWDADIIVDKNYFKAMEKITISDLSILPVKMNPVNSKTHFFANEFQYLAKINHAVYGWKRPIMANGANLLFQKSTFNKNLPYSNNLDIESGDDQFLLNNFIQHQNKISLVYLKELEAITTTPTTIKACIQQRLRWISKTSKVKDSLANLIGFIGVTYHLSPLLFLLNGISSLTVGFFVKIILDSIILNQNPLVSQNSFFRNILFSICYPFYSIFIFSFSVFSTISWKDRIIKK